MFFVFGPSGQMLRGGAEQLSRVTAVRRVQRPQALRSSAVEARGAEAFELQPPATPQAQSPPPSPPDSAFGSLRALGGISAYQQTDKPAPVRQPLTLVRDVMTEGALTLPLGTSVKEAWGMLAEHGISQAPVVDALGRVVGLLLRADMVPLELLPSPGSVPAAVARAKRLVDEVMVSPVATVSPDTALRSVASALMDTGLPGLPVTNELGLPEGFITRTDILRAVAADPPLDLWT